MLARRSRLTSADQFRRAVRSGRRAGSTTLVVHLHPGPATGPDAPPRAGFVVSRAVGPAVTRNRVRRRLRELVRARLPRLGSGAELVVRALPAAAHASYADLGTDLDRCLSRCLRRLPDGPPEGSPDGSPERARDRASERLRA